MEERGVEERGVEERGWRREGGGVEMDREGGWRGDGEI